MKLNKNRFPLQIIMYINGSGLASERKKYLIRQELKTWYQYNFQKNNRWNRTQLYGRIKDYSDQELKKLGAGFELLFNTDSPYHQVFLRYLKEFQIQREIAKSNLGIARLKVSQKTFEEIINYFGDLKRADKLQNTNKQIARILKLIMDPDKSLEESTITDRLMNKKGYY